MMRLPEFGRGARRLGVVAVAAMLFVSLLAPAVSAAGSFSVDESSLEGWSVDIGKAKKTVGKVAVEGLRTYRLDFSISEAREVRPGPDTVLPEGVFTIAGNGRVSYTGAEGLRGRPVVVLTIEVADNRKKDAVTVEARVNVNRPRIDIDFPSYSGWTVTSGESKDRVGKLVASGIPKNRLNIRLMLAYDDSGPLGADVFKIGNGGRLRYDGSALSGDVQLVFLLTDTLGYAGGHSLATWVTVNSSAPPEA